MENKKMTYALVEDNLQDQEIIIQQLKKHNLDCIGSYMLATEFLIAHSLQKMNFDLLITDVKMPVMDGVELIKAYRNIEPEIPILVVSHGFNKSILDDVKKYKNVSYCAKVSELLPSYVINAIKGDKLNSIPYNYWIDYSERYNLHMFDEIPKEFELSLFEKEILRLTADDHSIREIAIELKTSISHVSHTKTKLARRLNLPSTSYLLAYAIIYEQL
jgi:DNA-binding NarL/FixJ family response regulator